MFIMANILLKGKHCLFFEILLIYQNGEISQTNYQNIYLNQHHFLDKLTSNLCTASGIQCGKCESDMELVNICSK